MSNHWVTRSVFPDGLGLVYSPAYPNGFAFTSPTTAEGSSWVGVP